MSRSKVIERSEYLEVNLLYRNCIFPIWEHAKYRTANDTYSSQTLQWAQDGFRITAFGSDSSADRHGKIPTPLKVFSLQFV